MKALERKAHPQFEQGMQFVVVEPMDAHVSIGEVVTLQSNDDSKCPYYTNAEGITVVLYWSQVSLLEAMGSKGHPEIPEGTKFVCLKGCWNEFDVGEIVTLTVNDGSSCPGFEKADGSAYHFTTWSEVAPLQVVTKEVKEEVKEEPKEDMVDSPSHYTIGGMEPNDYLKMKLSPEEYIGYLKGQAIKYLSRAGHKGEAASDYQKANYYTDRMVNEVI